MTPEKEIILTIAIPTFNGGNSLITAVESCHNISLPPHKYEVLVVDNSSTDGSIETLEKMRHKFSFLRIIRNNINFGRVQNWNRCIKFSNGEFILFLFSNDLIAKNNYLAHCIDILKQNPDCSLLNAPWIISNFTMTQKSLPPQFFCRTPGNGFYDSCNHIKTVVESGKLPFVPLQSNFLRRSIIKEKNLLFDPELPISSDGVFLSELAIQSGVVAFYDKPSIIWRNDAPGRMHTKIKISEHIFQVITAIKIINGLFNPSFNITKAIANYEAPELIISSLISARTKNDFINLKYIILRWWKLCKKFKIKKFQFIIRLSWRIIKLPLKIRTLFLPGFK